MHIKKGPNDWYINRRLGPTSRSFSTLHTNHILTIFYFCSLDSKRHCRVKERAGEGDDGRGSRRSQAPGMLFNFLSYSTSNYYLQIDVCVTGSDEGHHDDT
jgi:hypothetical protein